jgi:hypothetical protein
VWKAIAQLNVSRDDLWIRVVDTDYGCGIIRNGENIPYISSGDFLTYEYYNSNKSKLLNVISISQFNQLFI